MADKNLYNLPAVTTANDSDLLHVNQGGVSSDVKITKQNLLKEVNSSITSLNNSLTNIGKRTLVAEEMKTTGTTFAYTGISFTLTKVSIVSASLSYTNTNTDTIAICGVNSGVSGNFYAQAKNNDVGGITPTRIFAYAVLPAGTYYVWAKSRSSGSNEVAVYKYQLEP